MKQRMTWLALSAIVLASCGGGDSDSSSDAAGDWCALAQQVEDASDAADAAFESGPEAMREAFEGFQSLLDEAAKIAPDEIAADVNTSADAVDQFAAIFDEVDYDLTAVDPSLFDELEELTDDSDAATDRIQAYNERECGIPADDADDADADTSDASDASGNDAVFVGDSNSAWCTANRDLDIDAQLEDVVFGDPTAIQATMSDLLDEVRALGDLAPDELTDAVATTIGGLEAFDAALAEADYDILVADLSILDDLDAEMSAAGDLIVAYNEQVCGITDTDVDGDDDDGDFDPSGGSIRDQTIDEFVRQGFSEEEAVCIFDGLDFSNPDLANDVDAIITIFEDCDIDLARIAEIFG